MKIQQVQRPGNLRQPFLAHVQVNRGGGQTGVAQEPLQNCDLDARFQ